MGSGFSACTGPSSVGVTEAGQSLNKSGGVHSDSCDSGISIGDGGGSNNRKASKGRHNASPRRDRPVDSEEEEEDDLVAGSDVACGPDFLMTSTPRGGTALDKASSKARPVPRAGGTRPLRHHSTGSVPNLLDHAIREEDEEGADGQPEDKRPRPHHAARPPRPKSAHFRKSRAAAQAQRGRGSRARSHVGSGSGGESSADMSSDGDEGEDGDAFDSDILSIPDETSSHQQRPNTLTTVRLGPHFAATTNARGGDSTPPTPRAKNSSSKNNNSVGTANRNHSTTDINSTTTTTRADDTRSAVETRHNASDLDWWEEEESGAESARTRDGGDSVRSGLTMRGSFTRGWGGAGDGRVAKKASERSISSILLTTAVELDSTAAGQATNPACFAVTNPEITQHILKVSNIPPASTLASCMRSLVRSASLTALDSRAPRGVVVGGDSRSDRSRRSLRREVHALSGANGVVGGGRRVLDKKLHEIFLVRPARGAVRKSPDKELEQKLRDLFVVTDAKGGRVKTPEEELGDAIRDLVLTSSDPKKVKDGSLVLTSDPKVTDGSLVLASDPTKVTDGSLVLASDPTKVTDGSLVLASSLPGRKKKLRSLLVSSRSESAIRVRGEGERKAKKRVTFSPDVPNVVKCSKNYRMRTVAFIAQRMRKASPNKVRHWEPKSKAKKPTFVCALCKKDCIQRIMI